MLDPDPKIQFIWINNIVQNLNLDWLIAVFDIVMVMRIEERKAQIARTAYFTIPAVSAAVGWMGALEIAKKVTLGSTSVFPPFFRVYILNSDVNTDRVGIELTELNLHVH